jgi:predicted  nucleic acid-binding Zn-ribbon protein
MIQWVKNLLELQEVDMRIKSLEQRLALIPGEVASRQTEKKSALEILKNKREELNKNSMSIKQVESAIKQKLDNINRLQSQSAMVKKNNEYQALMKEIEELQSGISDLETRQLELMDKVQEDDDRYKEFEKQYKAQESSIDEELQELNDLTGEIKTKIAELQNSRAPLTKKLEPEILNIYTRLLQKPGQPLVSVVNGDCCGHCHMRLIPQTLHNAQKGAVTLCDQCAHMLYTTG